MSVAYANLIIPIGTSFSRMVQTTIDLDGYQAEAKFSKSYYYTSVRRDFEVEILTPDSNAELWGVQFSLSPTDTVGLEPGYYVYSVDVYRVSPSSRFRLLEGIIDLQGSAT